MFDCPACSANLRFDPGTQDLGCPYCGNHYDVHAFDEEKGYAEDNTKYDVSVFTCPQCGGELLGDEQEAAVFCSYCGASNILESRLKKEKRPQKIIPFQVTKEDCKKRFLESVKKTGFAPGELKKDDIINSFRGIYMPYWSYSVGQHGNLHLSSEHSFQKGNYKITDRYQIGGRLDAEYTGYAKDSSASFADEISDAIAPYDHHEAKDFTPAYMSGFYADSSDVRSVVYEADARRLATEESERRIREYLQTEHKGKLQDHVTDAQLHTAVNSVENVMYPVWFFSYRMQDRVAYAAVNGQTGKVVADVPISKKTYYLTSFLIMIPVFLLLNLFFTVTPRTTLWVSMFFNVLTFIMFCWQASSIYRKEQKLDDSGWNSKMNRNNWESKRQKRKKKDQEAAEAAEEPAKSQEKKSFQQMVRDTLHINAMDLIMPVAALAGGILLLVDPVSDLWYYGMILVILVVILIGIIKMIDKYNLLVTNQLPQFHRTGGDDRA